MLDNRAFLRYNNTRSGGQPPETMHLSDHGPVAQLVRAPACHAGGRRFEPDPGRHQESASFRGGPDIRKNRSGGCREKCTEYAAVAHLVERHLAKVEVASSSLVGRSNRSGNSLLNMVTWPSGKARVCKTLIHQFKSGRHLQKIPGSFGFRDFFVLRCSLSASSPSPSPTVTDSPFCHLR